MNIETNINSSNQQESPPHAFGSGIDVDDSRIIESMNSSADKEFIHENRDLFERFNEVRSVKEASQIIKDADGLKEPYEKAQFRDRASKMYDLVKKLKDNYRSH